MSVGALNWAFELDLKPSSLKFLAVALANNAGDESLCYCSIETLTRRTCQDRKTVISGMAELEARGLIADTGQRVGRTHGVKVYRLVGFTESKSSSTENGTVQAVPKTGQLQNGSSTVFPSKQYRFSAEAVPKTVHRTILDPSEEPRGECAPANSVTEATRERSADPPPRTPNVPHESESQIRERIFQIKAKYPRAARESWIQAERLIRRLVEQGETWGAILAGVERYAAHCQQTGRPASDPKNFFGDVDRPWLMAWSMPNRAKPGAAVNDDALWADAKARGEAMGFRKPYPMETASCYMREVKQAENRPRAATGQVDVAAVLSKIRLKTGARA